VKAAIISDVHGNRLALEAVLEDIARHGVDGTFNLGDLVSGPLEPNWTADILMDLDLPTIRGNHERNLIEQPPDKLNAVDRFAQEQMESRHRAWINSLPTSLSLLDDVFLCHGTPTSDEEPWLDNWWDGRTVTTPDEATVAAKAEGYDYPVLLCGHTHVPRAVRLRDGRLIVNPGSVGLQMNHGSPDARYAIVERRDGKYYPSFHAVPYDHFAAARQAEANGFPQWRDALVTGWTGAAGLF
jgi:predicted phosphodiesterase